MPETIKTYLEKEPRLTRCVVGFPVTEDGKVILGLRKKVSWGLGENLISGLGGKVGDQPEFANETPDEALRRELREEIDLEIIRFTKVGEVIFLFPNKPKWDQYVVVYIIHEWTGEAAETESTKPMVYSSQALPAEQMWQDNGFWIPYALEGRNFKATFLYGNDNRTVEEHQLEIL